MLRVVFVEASSGGVVGGSLTGLYHMIRGLDRSRFAPVMVLYEKKRIEADLAALNVPVHHVHRRRLRKQHALLQFGGYHRAKRVGPVGRTLRLGRQGLRLLREELPAAFALARVLRRERADVVHLGNGVRANFDGILACRMTGTPVVCHVKGFEKYGDRERGACRHIASLVCMTEAIRVYCREHGVAAADTRVVYDAVDEAWLQPSRATAEIRSELGLPRRRVLLCAVGQHSGMEGPAGAGRGAGADRRRSAAGPRRDRRRCPPCRRRVRARAARPRRRARSGGSRPFPGLPRRHSRRHERARCRRACVGAAGAVRPRHPGGQCCWASRWSRRTPAACRS